MNEICKADIWHGNNIYMGFWFLLATEYSKIIAQWVTHVIKHIIANKSCKSEISLQRHLHTKDVLYFNVRFYIHTDNRILDRNM